MHSSNPFATSHLGRLLRALACTLALVGGAAAQDGGKPDQVQWVNARGQIATVTGTVVANGLEEVEVETSSSSRKIESASVERIQFGSVPESYRDGVGYLDRGDFENAAASFRLAASDPDARDVVRAAAQLRGARAEMLLGASDPAGFERAKEAGQRFLDDHAKNREVPEARLLVARASLLAGDATAAAEAYRSLFAEVASGTPPPGYSPTVCYRAGLGAAEAFLAAGEVLQAREIYGTLESSLPRVLAETEEGDVRRPELFLIQANARLGEGRCLLASEELGKAKTFFQGQLDAAEDSALRFGAELGLAETLLAQGETREAQLAFARVSALDHTDRDRVARALTGLAQCALELPDSNGRANAESWIEIVRERYGDTPAVLRARELAQNL